MKKTVNQTNKKIGRQPIRQIEKETNGKTVNQTNKKIERQPIRQKKRQVE